jgi:hypothetical protein
MCLSCASRDGAAAFPYSRDNYTFDGLLNLALSRWKQHWLALALASCALLFCMYVPAIALALPAGLMSGLDSPPGELSGASMLVQALGQLVANVVQLGTQLAMLGYCLDLIENKPAGLARSLERLKSLPAALLQLLIIYGSAALCAGVGYLVYRIAASAVSPQAAAITLGVLALPLLPLGSYIALGLVFTLFELAHNPEATALSAIRSSWQLAQGRRWPISGVLFVAGLIGGSGVLACCVGLLASGPLATLLACALFLALKRPTRPNAPAVAHEWPV